MKRAMRPKNPPVPVPHAPLLAVLVAVVGGCEAPTNPASDPGQVGHRLAVQPGAGNDRAALMALYDATDGENWKDNTNWGTDADLDDWYGVWTNSDRRVVHLVVQDNGLADQVPAALERLGALRRLDLSYHPNLEGGMPPELGNLSSLVNLDLR